MGNNIPRTEGAFENGMTREEVLLHGMRQSQSPVKWAFRVLKYARKAVSILSGKPTTPAQDLTAIMLDAFLYDKNETGPSAIETIMAETILNIIQLKETGKQGDTLEMGVFMETKLTDEGEGVKSSVRAGIVGTKRLDNPALPALDDMTCIERAMTASEVGMKLLALVSERTGEDGEKELYFDSDEVYAHFGMAVESVRTRKSF